MGTLDACHQELPVWYARTATREVLSPYGPNVVYQHLSEGDDVRCCLGLPDWRVLLKGDGQTAVATLSIAVAVVFPFCAILE